MERAKPRCVLVRNAAGVPAALRRVCLGHQVGAPEAASWRPGHCRGEVDRAARCARRTDRRRVDFVSTHTYGNLPLDPRRALRRHGFDGIPIWWTEWGIDAAHFGQVHDSAMGAPFVLSGLHSAQGRVDALAYWVISDQ